MHKNKKWVLSDILKNCPKGTRFWCDVVGEVSFHEIRTDDNKREITIILSDKNNKKLYLGKFGNLNLNFPECCILWPSKNVRTWEDWKLPKPKFDPKTLQPFDKVIVRIANEYNKPWFADFVSHRYKENEVPEVMSDTYSNMVIPFNDDTKHLLGTTENPPEFYRYWEF